MENKNIQSGFLLIDKPIGPTSHDIVNQLRKITKIKKIGHAGTLDPFASGLLIIAIGRESTKKISKFIKLDKEYQADLRLGATSTTHDPEGKISSSTNLIDKIKSKDIELVLYGYIGKQKQIPPMFSAKKKNGKKLYELARVGKTIKREPVDIKIYNIEILNFKWPKLTIKTKVSSGTYIRALARDIGKKLNCGAYLTALRRIKIDKYDIKNAHPISKITEKNWQKNLFQL